MTTYLTSKCHCGLNAFRVPVDSAKIPFHTDMCHCNPCRHVTGQLKVHCVPMIGPPLPADSTDGVDTPANLDTLVQYRTSNIGTRYFCGTCSAHMFIYITETPNGPEWLAMSGALEKLEGIAEVSEHIFVADTLDGGMADHFRTNNGKEIKRFNDWIGSAEIPFGWRSEKIRGKEDVESLPFFCRCNVIKFHLTRAKEKRDPSQYWLVPGRNEGDPIKFIAAHCLCSDCRLASGNMVQSWIVAPQENIIDSASGNPVVVEAGEKRMKGLKQYESSLGTYRDFCGTCGATVFWWTNKQEERLCVSAGLVDEEVQGVRAEKWLHWHDKVLHGKDALLSYTEDDLVDGTKKTADGK